MKHKNIPFVGRKEALEKLNSLLKKKSTSLVVIRGRRRIGKSRLVEEFAKDHRFYAFSGLVPDEKTTAQLQKEEFARQLAQILDLPTIKTDDWGDLLTLLAKQVKKGRIILLLDEISWLGSQDPTFLGKLKIVWDQYFSKNPQLILILCGSVSTWIEKNIISSTGFFGRVSQKILLEELPLPHAYKLLKEAGFKGSSTEVLMYLSITGGVPWYLELFKPSLTVLENIKQLCFEKEGILVEEFKKIFHDLFGKRSEIYQKIVRSLVNGSLEYSEISKCIDYPSGGPLSEYLEALVISGYITRDHVWSFQTGKERKLLHYRLCDNYLRYYLKYIEPNLHKIEKGHFAEKSPSHFVGWSTIMGLQFENLVLNNRKLIQKRLGLDPIDIVDDNPFFQRPTAKQSGSQIDYLIQMRQKTLYICEVKFSQNEIGSSIIEEMKEKICRLKVPKGYSCLPVLIYANGLSDAVRESDYFFATIDFSSLLIE